MFVMAKILVNIKKGNDIIATCIIEPKMIFFDENKHPSVAKSIFS